jgi:hypothetical protein
MSSCLVNASAGTQNTVNSLKGSVSIHQATVGLSRSRDIACAVPNDEASCCLEVHRPCSRQLRCRSCSLLSRFLTDRKHDQCGNICCKATWALFEKLRIHEGKPNTDFTSKKQKPIRMLARKGTQDGNGPLVCSLLRRLFCSSTKHVS